MQEAELIEGLIAQRPEAQSALVETYRRRLLATAWHFLGHQDPDAEDVVQEAFIAAFKHIDGFERRSSLYTWINHICVNLCFSQVRKRKRLLSTEAQDLERLLVPASLMQDADEQLQARRRRELLKGWIEGLEQRCQEVLNLRFTAGLGLAQIKDRLKVPLGTVASRLRRCQAALQEKARQS